MDPLVSVDDISAGIQPHDGPPFMSVWGPWVGLTAYRTASGQEYYYSATTEVTLMQGTWSKTLMSRSGAVQGTTYYYVDFSFQGFFPKYSGSTPHGTCSLPCQSRRRHQRGQRGQILASARSD